MHIAIIGWGSLIWSPGSLRLKSKWHADGPFLPIEFARISSDGRLTLVIHPESSEVQTYWAVSAYDTINDAREDLRKREAASSISAIHCVQLAGTKAEIDARTESSMLSWLRNHTAVEAAVLTGLNSNWTKLRGQRFTVDDAMRYLSELKSGSEAQRYARAQEYIRKAPEQIQTELRLVLERHPEFRAVPLPPTLFEQSPQLKGRTEE